MPAGRLDLVIEQGATFEKTITWTDDEGTAVDITGYEARLQVRPDADSSTVLLDLDNDTKGGIDIPLGTDGVIVVTVPAADTASLTFREAVYDLELESPGGDVTRLLEGVVELSKEVTQ